MRRILVALATAIAMLLGTSQVYAHREGPPPDGRGMHAHEKWFHEEGMSLTPEQKAKVEDLHRSFLKENAQLIGSLVTKRLELRSLWTDPKAEDKAIMDKEKELSALRAQIKDKAFQMRLAFRKLLTPEQLANWRWGEGMGHRGMMGGHGMMGHHGMRGCQEGHE